MQTMSKTLSSLLLCLIGISFASSCADQPRTARQTNEEIAQPPAPCFRVGYLNITASAPLFVAKARRMFDSAGLCIRDEVLASSNQLVDALAADRLDYVVETSAVPALALHAASLGRFYITAASRISEQEPFDALLVRRDGSIDSIPQLAGKRIAVFPGTTASTLLRAYLQDSGVNVADVEFVPTPPSNLLAGLKSRAVDASHVYEPAWTIGANDPDLVVLLDNIYGRQLSPNPQGISLLNAQTASEYPEASKKLVAVFDSALLFMKENDLETRHILRSHFQLPGNTVDEMHLLYMSPHNEIDWDALNAYAVLLHELEELSTRPDVEELRYAPQ